MKGGGQLFDVGPLGRDRLGGHFTLCHSVFVYRANSVTRSDVPGVVTVVVVVVLGVRGGGGLRGNVLYFTQTASWDSPREASFT